MRQSYPVLPSTVGGVFFRSGTTSPRSAADKICLFFRGGQAPSSYTSLLLPSSSGAHEQRRTA